LRDPKFASVLNLRKMPDYLNITNAGVIYYI
jgi:hypothetical protein